MTWPSAPPAWPPPASSWASLTSTGCSSARSSSAAARPTFRPWTTGSTCSSSRNGALAPAWFTCAISARKKVVSQVTASPPAQVAWAQFNRREAEMPKASKESASQGGDHGPVVERSEELGDYTVNFLTFRQDIDQAALLKGAPDDSCQCPHWG